jgi:HD-GYP domain-containing protein (c-di-GMP phosphodiesterase class II)
VLTVADICEAMSAKRPYRDAMSWDRIEEILAKDVGTGVDADCLEAVQRWRAARELPSRVESQLEEVERLLTQF